MTSTTHAYAVTEPKGGSKPVKAGVVRLVPKKNLYTGETGFTKHFKPATTLERDLLCLASAVYAADVLSERGKREEASRVIDVEVPVVNHAVFASETKRLEKILYLLSSDAWTLKFIKMNGAPEANLTWPEDTGAQTLLFSGGLDSLAYAYRLAKDAAPIILVSHDSGNPVTKRSQQDLTQALDKIAAPSPTHVELRVALKDDREFELPDGREPSQRCRSFMFLALAGLVARRTGAHEVVYIAENGQMAIHLPLTSARIGCFSTRTAHPQVVAEMGVVLEKLLGVPLRFENPFLYDTKAEVVRSLCAEQPELVGKAVSCWRASRLPRSGPHTHCGECVPCLVRRIALEHNGLKVSAEYQRDLLSENVSKLAADDEGKRNLTELALFASRFRMKRSQQDYVLDFPELVSKYFDAAKAIDMYQRFSNEAATVLSKYPPLAPLLA
jgi:7-cyano-7-deazaguanine synthase in queuosine biosynthesis